MRATSSRGTVAPRAIMSSTNACHPDRVRRVLAIGAAPWQAIVHVFSTTSRPVPAGRFWADAGTPAASAHATINAPRGPGSRITGILNKSMSRYFQLDYANRDVL
jgi:hypothetical protein